MLSASCGSCPSFSCIKCFWLYAQTAQAHAAELQQLRDQLNRSLDAKSALAQAQGELLRKSAIAENATSALQRVSDALTRASFDVSLSPTSDAPVSMVSLLTDAQSVKAFGSQLEAFVRHVVSSAASSTHAQLEAVHAKQVT
jgi:hypothetical protein